jgi:hypothetical protein
MFGLPTNKSIRTTDYGRLMEERFARVYEAARENLGLTFRRMAAQYIQPEPEPINIGDEVFFFTPVVKRGGVRKLNLFWTGPWQVTKKKGILYDLIPSGNWAKLTRRDKVTTVRDRLHPFAAQHHNLMNQYKEMRFDPRELHDPEDPSLEEATAEELLNREPHQIVVKVVPEALAKLLDLPNISNASIKLDPLLPVFQPLPPDTPAYHTTPSPIRGTSPTPSLRSDIVEELNPALYQDLEWDQMEETSITSKRPLSPQEEEQETKKHHIRTSTPESMLSAPSPLSPSTPTPPSPIPSTSSS